MTKTNVQPTPSNFQHHDTPNNKTQPSPQPDNRPSRRSLKP